MCTKRSRSKQYTFEGMCRAATPTIVVVQETVNVLHRRHFGNVVRANAGSSKVAPVSVSACRAVLGADFGQSNRGPKRSLGLA